MSLPIKGEALDLGDVSFVFPIFLNNVGICTYCRNVVILVLKTFLFLVLFARLALVGGKLLMLTIRYVNGNSVSRLSFSGVFFLFFCGRIPLGTL